LGGGGVDAVCCMHHSACGILGASVMLHMGLAFVAVLYTCCRPCLHFTPTLQDAAQLTGTAVDILWCVAVCILGVRD
jgi:hypothetical protein